jgi:hypothetical protein
MASLPGPESRDVQEMIRHLKWSRAEKQIARKAFELALDREFRNVIRRAKDMVRQHRTTDRSLGSGALSDREPQEDQSHIRLSILGSD